jgi:hypothetical protein
MPATPRKSNCTPIVPSAHSERAFPFSDFLTQPVYSSPRQYPRACLQVTYDGEEDDDNDNDPSAELPYDTNFPGQYSPFLVHKTVRAPGVGGSGRRLNSPVPRIDTSVVGASTVATGEWHAMRTVYDHDHDNDDDHDHDQEVPTLIMSDSTHAPTTLVSVPFHERAGTIDHRPRPRGRGFVPKPLQTLGKRTVRDHLRDHFDVDDNDQDEDDIQIWIENAEDLDHSNLTTIQEQQISTPELSETGTVVPSPEREVDRHHHRLVRDLAGLGLRTNRPRQGPTLPLVDLGQHPNDTEDMPRGRTMERKRTNRRGRHLLSG